jgi:hypothetical protein
MKCRNCNQELNQVFANLGFAPPSNSYLEPEAINFPETYYPLKVMVCEGCFLVQTEDHASPEIFFSDKYAYLSSASSSWLKHSQDFSSHIIELLGLNENSTVVEIASNDGYLLENFVAEGIPCFGIEPTASTALISKNKGIPTIQEFFTEEI